MTKLSKEDLVAMQTLDAKGQSKRHIARMLGVSEGTVRYQLKRQQQQSLDGRQQQPAKADAVAEVIRDWLELHESESRPANLRALYEFLVEEHAYDGSYRCLVRYIRKRYPKPKQRTYRRVETPPGAQMQVDWFESHDIDIGCGPQTLYGFIVTLSHSRKEAVVWCERMDQSNWHWAHNAAFVRLGGIPAVARIDNLKTGMAKGAGPWGEINACYRRYSELVGFHVDACLPAHPEHKGKVERRVSGVRQALEPHLRPFLSLEELQAWTDERLQRRAHRRRCPATGKSVHESWLEEAELLRPPTQLPEPFDVVVKRPVHKDCIIYFEDHVYGVPFQLVGQLVEVHGAGAEVLVWYDGKCVRRHPRHTERRVLIDESDYAGEATETLLAPLPLGKMGKRLAELASEPVQHRSLELYEALAEVAR